tara:strand:+ start:4134 stop:4310 length:177 start_codon:yes stop_codon:yes gene_type:complete
MVQALLVKLVFKKIMEAIEKADDKRIASNHEKRIKKLEKMAHPKRDIICKGCKDKGSK